MNAQPSFDRWRLVLRVVGWVGVLSSLFGLSTDKLNLSTFPISGQPAELRAVYYTMAGTDIAIMMATFLVAAGLTRGWPKWVPFFVGVQVLVLLAFVVPAVPELFPRFGQAISKATPLYSGGTGLLVVTLYPFWASFAALWAAHRMGTGQTRVPS